MKAKFTHEEITTLANEIAIMGFELDDNRIYTNCYTFSHPEYPNWFWNIHITHKLPAAHEIMYYLIEWIRERAIENHSGWC